MNPLTETCLNVMKYGYSQTKPYVESPYKNITLQHLSEFLLRKSGVELHDALRFRDPVENNLAICFGGGIDSYCALILALSHHPAQRPAKAWIFNTDKIYLIHCNYGQPYASQEREVFNEIKYFWARKTLDDRRIPIWQDLRRFSEIPEDFLRFVSIDNPAIPCPENMDWENYIIPGRNLYLASIGAEYAGNIWIVATKRGDESVGTPDKTSRFYNQASVAFSEFYASRRQVSSPFINKSKLEVVKDYLLAGGSLEALKRTFSCYSPVDGDITACGTCYACYKKYTLFQKLNEPLNFAKHPKDGRNFQVFQERERAKRG